MPNRKNENTYIQSVGNTFEIIEMLICQDNMSLSELTQRSNLSKSSIHNHLNTLANLGYVTKKDGEYQLGLRCLTLGGYARENHRLYQTAQSVVDHLAQTTGELALVTTYNDGKSIYLYQNQGSNAITTDSYPGIRLPLHCTATGKAMLAFMNRDRVKKILEQEGLSKQTKNTITSSEQLFEELDRIRDRQVALDDEERILGMRGIASPIIKRDSGQVMGALSITGPSSRIEDKEFTEKIPEIILKNAEMLEVNIMYS